MDKIFIKQYIYNLTTDTGLQLCKKNGINATKDEVNKILAFLRKNVNEIDIKNKDNLLKKLKKEVPDSTYKKSELLLNKILKI